MKLITAILLCLLMLGCAKPEEISAHDQCLRVELFQQCMASLPAGPVATKYNDWDEVVAQCERVAYFQSIRPRLGIKPECMI